MKWSLRFGVILSLVASSCSLVESSTTTTDPGPNALSQAIVVVARSVSDETSSQIAILDRAEAVLTFVVCPWYESFEISDIDRISSEEATDRGIQLIVGSEGKSINGTTVGTAQYIDGFQAFIEEVSEQEDPAWPFIVCEELRKDG